MNKKFSMIDNGLPYSEKYRMVDSLSKLVYNHLHTYSGNNYLGVYEYNAVALSEEIDIATKELEACLRQLATVRLIELDEDHKIIRIVAWFDKVNCMKNLGQTKRTCRSFEELSFLDRPITHNAIAEFIFSTLKKGLKWEKEAVGMRHLLGKFIQGMLVDYDEMFKTAMHQKISQATASLKKELFALAPQLSKACNTVLTPCDDKEKKRQEIENKTISKKKRITNEFSSNECSEKITPSLALKKTSRQDLRDKQAKARPRAETIEKARSMGCLGKE